jgi:hypothetical protein
VIRGIVENSDIIDDRPHREGIHVPCAGVEDCVDSVKCQPDVRSFARIHQASCPELEIPEGRAAGSAIAGQIVQGGYRQIPARPTALLPCLEPGRHSVLLRYR